MMDRHETQEIAAMLAAACVERARVAKFIEHNARVHEELEGQSNTSDKWHAEMSKQLYELADRIRGGVF